jgi:hypothetical protein
MWVHSYIHMLSVYWMGWWIEFSGLAWLLAYLLACSLARLQVKDQVGQLRALDFGGDLTRWRCCYK